MPTIVCPTCATKLEIDDDRVGQDVQCGSCQQIFKAESETKRSSRRGETDEDEKPRKSKYRKDDDDDGDEERPSERRRMSRDEDDEDYEDRPSRRRRSRGNTGADSNSMGVAALVLGIIGLVGSFCCCIFLVADVMAIIFGILALKTSSKGMGIAGIILGGIGILLFIGAFALNIGMGMMGGPGAGGGGFNNQNRFK